MKTNHSITTLLLLLSLGMTSCSTYYRMTSRIDTNGSMHREVYARGDSAFIAGDKTHNPFLFQLDTDWQIVNLDSTLKFNFWGEEEKLNVKSLPEYSPDKWRIFLYLQWKRTDELFGNTIGAC